MNFEKQDEEITLVVNKAPGNKNLPHGLCSRMSTRAYCSGGRGGPLRQLVRAGYASSPARITLGV